MIEIYRRAKDISSLDFQDKLHGWQRGSSETSKFRKCHSPLIEISWQSIQGSYQVSKGKGSKIPPQQISRLVHLFLLHPPISALLDY